MNYMHNLEVLRTIVEKFTPTLGYRFYVFTRTQPKEDLLKIGKFLKREAEFFGRYALRWRSDFAFISHYTEETTVASQRYSEHLDTSKFPVYEEAGHTSTDCEQVKNLDVNAKMGHGQVQMSPLSMSSL